MTIEDYKKKLDVYLGIIGELTLLEDGKHSTTYAITYNALSGVPIVTYRIVRSKIHPMPYGWYESGSCSVTLPDLDEDTKANHELWPKRWNYFYK